MRSLTIALATLLCCSGAHATNFSTGTNVATKFGVHEIRLTSSEPKANPFDALASVTFEYPKDASNQPREVTVQAFYDGNNHWVARLYVDALGQWNWRSHCETDSMLDGKSGIFYAADPADGNEEKPGGRLLSHPGNPGQWVQENGKWFLNISDTAYFLLCSHDGNGDPVSDDTALNYAADDVAHGITSIRCFLACRHEGFEESTKQWDAWFFTNGQRDQLALENLQQADRRLQLLLDRHPNLAVQLILFPLAEYGRDDRFWNQLSKIQRERLLRNIVARFAAYPQIFWLIVNDAHFGDKFPNNNAMAREAGNYLKAHDPWSHPRSAGHARMIPFAFGGEEWVDYVHIEHAHDLSASHCAQYLAHNKPVFLGEDRYEQDHGLTRDPVNMRYWQRRLMWSWLLSGGSANYGGRWWTVQPYSQTGAISATFYRRPQVTFRDQLQGLDSVMFIHNFFDDHKINLAAFIPDSELIVVDARHLGEGSPKAMRRGGDEFLIYHPLAASNGQKAQVNADQTATITLDLSNFTGKFSVSWLRTLDGQSQTAPDIDGGTKATLIAPWPGVDVVLRLKRS